MHSTRAQWPHADMSVIHCNRFSDRIIATMTVTRARSHRPSTTVPRATSGRLRWQAYERFQQQLIASRIRPGQFVSQRELAAPIGLPLGAIREVIPRLEAEGLLQTAPQRGLQIATVDVKLVR